MILIDLTLTVVAKTELPLERALLASGGLPFETVENWSQVFDVLVGVGVLGHRVVSPIEGRDVHLILLLPI